MTSKDQFVRVPRIEGPGKYVFANRHTNRFANCGNWNSMISETDEVENNIHGEQPKVKYGEIPRHLIERFPHMGLQRFIKAEIYDGEYTPARIEVKAIDEDETFWESGSDFIVVDGQAYQVSSGRIYSNGAGNWEFSIRDVGRLRIVKNKLVETRLVGRDGKLRLDITGSAPHYSRRGMIDYWRAWVEYEGESPGRLVQETVNYINSEARRLKAPLLKERAA
jgi:hypothetical protein